MDELTKEAMGNWFLALLNDKGRWTMKGPFDSGEAQREFERHQSIMPNCPAKLVEIKVWGEYTPVVMVA